MKKIISITMAIILIAISLLCFSSCGKKTDEKINVAVLNGTTGFGMAHLMEANENQESKNEYNFTVQKDAAKIMSDLIAGTVDIAALPTNAAANAFNKSNGGVQIIAINTLGVLNIMQTGEGERIDDIKDLQGKTIYCPAQNPAQILNYILKQNNVTATVKTDFAVPADLVSAFMTQKTKDKAGADIAIDIDIAVIPQPMATQVLSKKGAAGYTLSLDLSEEWKKVSDEELVQGCIVVRKDFADEFPGSVDAFLKEYKDSIDFTNENPKEAAEYIVKYGIANDATLAENAIPKSNIVYIDGDDMEEKMQNFLDSLGIKLGEGTFYYK